MDQSVDWYFQQGLAPSTQKTYASAQKRYINFCTLHSLPLLPALEPQVCQFISYLADEKVGHSSIKAYLSALRHLHIAKGLPDPKIGDMSKLEQVLRGIKRAQSKLIAPPRVRLPITPDILKKIRKVWNEDGQNPDKILLWAAACTCFFGFMRAGEITVPSEKAYDPSGHLSFNDVAIDNPNSPQLLKVHLKASKTDPFRKGVDIFLGRTRGDLCPVAAMLAFLVCRGNHTGFLFTFRDGRLLTKSRFISEVRKALTKARVDCKKYSGHSFRIGAATTAHQAGLSDATIKMLGRWESSAYLLYVRTPREELASFSPLLLSRSQVGPTASQS